MTANTSKKLSKKISNAKIRKFTAIRETIDSADRLEAIKKYILENEREKYRCYNPYKNGGVIFTDGYTMYRLKCNYLPFDVGFTKGQKDKTEYLEKYKGVIGNVLTDEYIDASNVISENTLDTEITINMEEVVRIASEGTNHGDIGFKAEDYTIVLDSQYIITATQI